MVLPDAQGKKPARCMELLHIRSEGNAASHCREFQWCGDCKQHQLALAASPNAALSADKTGDSCAGGKETMGVTDHK